MNHRTICVALATAAVIAFSTSARAEESDVANKLIGTLIEKSIQLQQENDQLRAAAAAQPPATSPAGAPASLSQAQFDAMAKQFMSSNQGFVAETILKYVNSQQAAQQAAGQPQAADFAKRRDDLFTKDAVYVGAAPDKAKVRLVEFADYNCHFCRDLQPEIEKLLADNPDVEVVYRDMPILHPTSRLAAQAARAAARQGKLDVFRRGLYSLVIARSQDAQGDLIHLAEQNGLDVERFKADMLAADVVSAVTSDKNLGDSLKVSGTPTLWVDGADHVQPGALSEAELQKMVDAARAQNGSPATKS